MRRAGVGTKVQEVQLDSGQKRASFCYETLHVEERTDESILKNNQLVVRIRRPFARGVHPDFPIFVSERLRPRHQEFHSGDRGRPRRRPARGGTRPAEQRLFRESPLLPGLQADLYRGIRPLVRTGRQGPRAGRRLAPGSAEAYFKWGQTYYDRAALEDPKDAKPWFDFAAANFTSAVERDGRHYMAWDMLGLVHSSTGEWDMAISDFTQEMALNPLGKARLADAYCERGLSRQRERNYAPSVADYEKAIEIGTTADGCSCDPYTPLVANYVSESRQYDKAWEVVHKAQKSKRWIAPELLESLKKDSGRNN